MVGGSFDDASDEHELARLAYSRPVDGVDPAQAQAQLAALAEARNPPPEPEWHSPTLPAPPTRHEKLHVAVAAAAVVVIASALAMAPVSSLTVFGSAQSGAPTWPGQGGEDARWLASSNGWDVFGFVTDGGSICLASVEGPVSAGGACTSRGVFETIGLRMGTSRLSGESTEYLSVQWGPTGGARVSDLPLAEWTN
ncbi:MAG: hypothetical protein H7226_10800 [Salinibacterium sp.]|nr:hypothetical protein [Salinibacterium sp.]